MGCERRATERLNLARPCKTYVPRIGKYLAGLTWNVSAGGALLQLDRPAPIEPGDRLFLGVALKGRQTIFCSTEMIESFKPVFEEPFAESEDVRSHHNRKIIQFMPSRPESRSTDLSLRTDVSNETVHEKEKGFSPAVETYMESFPEMKKEPGQPEGLVWQVHNKYIISQVKSGLTIIDQHVAHERILYEKALASIEKGVGVSQQLLFPHKVELSPEDYSVLLEILVFLNQIGFEIVEFGERTLLINAVPADIKAGSEGRVLGEIIDNFRETNGKEVPAHRALAASFGCKAAIKAGEKLTQEEMISLVERLFTTEYPYFCPHGRPIIINLTLDELDKRFERK